MVLLIVATPKALTTENIVPTLKKAGFVTTENIVPILKKAGFATKDDVREILDQEITSKRLATKDDVNDIVKSSERRMIRKMNLIKRDLAQRIATLAINTPTRKEFDELKKQTKSYL